MSRKKITPITERDINAIINNSVQGAGNRLVGSAAEQKKLFVRPIANTDGTPNVASLVKRLAAETEEAMQQLENNVEDLEDSLVAPPPADSIPLSGVFLTYDRATETLEIVGEQGVDEEDVSEIVGTETNERFTELDNSITALSNSKQDKIEIADNYDSTTNKVATEATVAKEVAKVVGGAGESFDTLKEIADWIAAHPNSVAEINAKIAENTAKINTHTRDIALNTSRADRNTSDIAAQAQRITSVQSSVNALSTSKQDKLSIADGYSSENPVATVRTVSDKIAEVVGGADASFDTLKEIADWINNNPESVAAINAKLSEHAQAIANNAEGITENALAIEENEEAIERAEVKATQAANTANEAARRIGVAEADIANLRDGKQNVLMFADEYSEQSKVATERTVEREVAKIVADAPDNFNTLKEIAEWIAAHPNDISMLNALVQENSRGIALNASLIVNNTKAINDNAKRINNAEIGLNDVNEYYSRLSKTVEDKADKDTVSMIMDTTVGKTNMPNQLYGTDADGNPALYPTDSVGTQVLVDGQKVDEFNADEKFDKTGGVIDGEVTIEGDLIVKGTTKTVDTETLSVKDNIIVANVDNAPLAGVSGFAVKTGEVDEETQKQLAYGIMYDKLGNGVKIGIGGFDGNGEFVYGDLIVENEDGTTETIVGGQAQFLATRADTLMDGHIPKWDYEKNQFVDSGVRHDEVVKKTDKASDNTAGLLETYFNKYSSGIEFLAGKAKIYGAKKNDIDNKISDTLPITPSTNDYATMSALADCKDTTLWTDNATVNGEYIIGTKQKARNLLGAVGFNNVAGNGVVGLIAVSNSFCSQVTSSGVLMCRVLPLSEYQKGTTAAFIAKGTLENIKYNYVMEGLANYTVAEGETSIWTPEAQAKACETIGAVPSKKVTSGLQLYGANVSGNSTFLADVGTAGYSIARRGSGGALAVGGPTEDNHAVPKKYAEDNFISKTVYGGIITSAIGFNGSGDIAQTGITVDGLYAYSIPMRNQKGVVFGSIPSENEEYGLTPKKYVDDNKGTKLYLHNITFTETNIGPEEKSNAIKIISTKETTYTSLSISDFIDGSMIDFKIYMFTGSEQEWSNYRSVSNSKIKIHGIVDPVTTASIAFSQINGALVDEVTEL